MLNGMPGPAAKKSKPLHKGWLAGVLFLLALLLAGFFWVRIDYLSKPREAPEAERVLKAQAELPFQVLIPAYLPHLFKREKAEIVMDQPGPNGEKMIRLIYPTRKGDTLTLSEWLPAVQAPGKAVSSAPRCLCVCQTNQQCNMIGMELNV